jgi:metal-sulfur cluster biosynthetic enzyme
MVTEAEVRATLDGVIHPSFGMSLIALGMVHTVRVKPGTIEVDLMMNCPGCPGAEAALALTRERLHALDSASAVRMTLLPHIWTPPWE